MVVVVVMMVVVAILLGASGVCANEIMTVPSGNSGK